MKTIPVRLSVTALLLMGLVTPGLTTPQSANLRETDVKKPVPARNVIETGEAPAANESWPEEGLYLQLTSGEPKSSRALKRVLKTPGEFSAAILYVGCGAAFRLQRLEDAGFLLYVAHIRAEFDYALFPPIGTGEDNPLLALHALHVELGTVLSPALMAEPKSFAQVLTRVKAWQPRVPPGFKPGWEYSKKGSEKQAERAMADARKDLVAQLSDFSTLLQDAAYFAAFKTVQDYNLKVADESGRPTKEAYESACHAMEQIEKEKSIVGFAASFKSRSGP
jgi:hypothetical protein